MAARKPKAEAVEATPMLSLIDQDAPEGGALVVTKPDLPIAAQATRAAQIVLLQPERFDQFYERMKAELAGYVPDLTTAKGRAECAAMAFRVTKTKTTLAAAALDLTADWRARTKAVNDARGPIVQRLDDLAAEVRKPLTDWEAAESARLAANRAVIDDMRQAATVQPDDTAASVEERGKRIWNIDLTAWPDEERVEAEDAKKATVGALVAARNRLRQEEADRAELARLRADAAERERVAEEERLAREAAEREAQEAREREEAAERERVAAEERAAEAERQRERDRQEAADAARREAEEAAAAREREAQAERDRIAEAERAEHERQLAAERAERERIEREAAEREAAAERERLAREAQARREEEERERLAAEERRRQANRAHRSRVQGEAKDALMTCGLDEEQARKVVLAIVAGNVPHCTVTF